MLVAVFNRTTSWFTRTIIYDEVQRRFVLQDGGPVTAQDVLGHDAQGRLDWAYDGLREWVADYADWERFYRGHVPGAAPPTSSPVGSAPQGVATRETQRPSAIGTAGSAGQATPSRPYSRQRVFRSVVVSLFVMVAVVGMTLFHNGTNGPATRGTQPTPAPGTVARITDPAVIESPAITGFVNLLIKADDHVARSWLHGSSPQYRAAVSGLRTARARRPKDDGSRQWARAERCAVAMRAVVKYEGRVVHDSLAGDRTALDRDTRSFHKWVGRKNKAMTAYFAYVYVENWGGYYAVGRHFTSVTATWVQPRLLAYGTTTRRVDIWVGLDGGAGTSHTCEQAGIAIVKQSEWGTDYWAWYEMLPRPPVPIDTAQPLDGSGSKAMVVNAGDTVTATVTSLPSHRFTLTLVDSTRSETFSVTRTNRAAECSTAEIIVESHLSHHPLADFEPVHFVKCAIDGRPISSFHVKKVDLTGMGDLVLTRTSALENGGTGFTITRR